MSCHPRGFIFERGIMAANGTPNGRTDGPRTVVIGAGIGGLAAALSLAVAGREVIVFEAAEAPGGKMRALPSPAGPVDSGPTVFTLKPYFDDLFAVAGTRLENEVDIASESLLARHFWPCGGRLDLFSDAGRSAEAVTAFAGARDGAAFSRLAADARRLFDAFEGPVMRRPRPSLGGIARALFADPGLTPLLAPPRTLWQALSRRFEDPRLAQLFARYATYVGGSPYATPALLMLIWEAESRGVWRIEGGMSALAQALARLVERWGGILHLGTPVAEIIVAHGRASGVRLADGELVRADSIVFNGDPAALGQGALGAAARKAAPCVSAKKRALSAYVWAFAAKPEGRAGADLAHHSVFFNANYRAEFDAIARGEMPTDATLYVCAQDRGIGRTPQGLERFEIIMNGPAHAAAGPDMRGNEEEFDRCLTTTTGLLAAQGLSFTPQPGRTALSTPQDFARRYPGSSGSLYGQSPHGAMAAFERPGPRSAIPGLFLAGGGVHPGAGVPMAMLSGRHAAAEILRDPISLSPSRRTAMHGGMSTASPRMAAARSPSSPS